MVPFLIAGAAIGAAAGGISVFQRSRRERERIAQQKQMAQEAFRYRQAFEESAWNLQRTHALDELGIQSGRLAQAFNMDMDAFRQGLEGQALQNRAARVSLADNAGMAQVQQGASGTRGSDSLQRRIDFHEGQFDRQLDLQARGNSLFLQNMTTQYSNQFNDIGREIDSWSAGGFRYEGRSLSNAYAANMHGLQMRGFQWEKDNARAGPLDFLTGLLGGAASGANFGSMLGDFSNQGGALPSLPRSPVNSTPRITSSNAQTGRPAEVINWRER